jgi:hypothetical protein
MAKSNLSLVDDYLPNEGVPLIDEVEPRIADEPVN